jgi:anti-sigma B factor antagonist
MSEKPVIVQRLPGRITSVEARSLFHQIQPCLQGLRPRVVFDFSDVRALDVKGVGMLLRCLEIVMKENGDLKLAAIPQNQELLCELSHLHGLFETFETTREAVESFHIFSPRDLELNSQLLASNLGAAQLSTSGWSRRATLGKSLRITNHLLTRLVSAIVVLAMLAASSAGAAAPQQAPASQEHPADPTRVPPAAASPDPAQQTQPAAPGDATQQNSTPPATGTPVPDSPGTVRSQPAEKTSTPPPSTPQAPASGPATPLGTAAAELTSTSGVAASKPAGAAFAPAKQHRVRTIVISMGAILGAGIAIGTVAALSQSSPSKPPGAH